MCRRCMDTNEQMKSEGCNPVDAHEGGLIGSKERPEVNGKQDVSIPVDPPLTTSPTSSLRSCESFASTSSDSSVDLNSDRRNDQVDRREEGTKEEHGDRLHGRFKTLSSVVPVNAYEKFDVPLDNGHKGENIDSIEIKGANDDNTVRLPDDENEPPCLFDDTTDSEIWTPPPADNEGSVCDLGDDDDEECEDGEWGKPSSLSAFEDEEGESRTFWFKEEKDKAMKEVMNGKFRTLVGQLLKTAGIVDLEKEGESWVDIVSNLAWDAASFIKPDTSEAKTMDPAGYVKVKCVATGSRSQSQLIKGLVFKKHAAHKHMPTKCTKPRILLIQGMLGHSSGLSSFNSMIAQDKDGSQKDNMGQDVKSLLENLEACKPDVVLVEKSAPRDVLEAILKMGVTLVVDMKLHRLERIARCTGSPILSADIMLSQKLKHCDLLYFERFVEEHAQVVEGAKKPSKTLMFLVGSPTRLGCTILLKGSHSEELKKIKCVIQCAVVMAYHFILETSFLTDQEAMFSTIVSDVVATRAKDSSDINSSASVSLASASGDKTDLLVHGRYHKENPVESSMLSSEQQKLQSVGSDCSSGSSEMNFSLESVSGDAVDIPISGCSNGLHDGEPEQPSSTSQHQSIVQQVVGSLVSPADQYMEPFLHINGGDSDALAANGSSVSSIDGVVPVGCGSESSANTDDENSVCAGDNNSQRLSSPSAATPHVREVANDVGDCEGRRGDINSMLDSQSILVLMSSRNASRGTICEQSHFSHIKFYKNFDVPLGKFLRDNLFNKNSPCRACSQPPEAHFYYYAHHNKQLTIRVKQIHGQKPFPGESDGKLWMWSRCGKCKVEKDCNSYATKRVLVSSAARGLSFGKFLKLSFSNHSSLNRLSNCGHSLHRDFLYFFGSGDMVAMFKYSAVATYSVSVPPQKLEFNSSIKVEWLQKETEHVYSRAMSLFKEVAGYLKKVESRFLGITLNLNGSIKEFFDIQKMLELENHEFEENITNTCMKDGKSVRKLLFLNRLRWELLLEACIWNRRLQLLLPLTYPSPDSSVTSKAVQEKSNPIVVQGADGESKAALPAADLGSQQVVSDDKSNKNENDARVEVPIEKVSDHGESSAGEFDSEPQDSEQDEVLSVVGDSNSKPSTESQVGTPSEDASSSQQVLTEIEIPVVEEPGNGESTASKGLSDKDTSASVSNPENTQGKWIWSPFSEIREKCFMDLDHKGQLLTFQDSLRFDRLHSPNDLPTIAQIISEEDSRMHIPLGDDEYILSDYEGEISSIVACALAVVKDVPQQNQSPLEGNDDPQSLGNPISTEDLISLPRAVSQPSSFRSPSSSSLQSDLVHLAPSLSLVESRFSSFDGLNLLDSLVSFGALHPGVALGMEKHLGKWKYSVVCMYAKEFRDLRKKCCPSEVDYIASLSRCKPWDAKGGKSKSIFAKTLDDRLIVKEIKRTEFDSFIKFAPAYFQHMNQSFESGNQTCLAKILGIYQVTVRHPRSGKETKHDLMVMENLSFGRNITRQYDLKGALHARFTANADGSGDVLLDQNFVNDMNDSPLYIVQRAKRLLQRAVWNDTTFLNSINVMDYSLLVGVDRKQKELVCGIIDYLRQYTWDKQLETWVKTSLVVPKNVLPTVISPREYKKRFRKFMDTHFLTVPDCWRSLGPPDPCKLCGVVGGDHHPMHHKPDKQDAA